MSQYLYHHEAEQSLLGSILLEPEIIKEISITPEFFSPGTHQNIFRAMREVDKQEKPVEIVSIIEFVGKDNLSTIGGIAYLTQLSGSVASTARFSYYENVIREFWQKRRVVEIANQIKESVASEEPSTTIQTGISELMLLEEKNDADDGSIRETLFTVYQKLERPRGEVTGIPTGFRELDSMLSGLQKQDLVIIAARPSVGKTAFALNIAKGVSSRPESVAAIFSLEMSKEKLVERMISITGNIRGQHIRAGLTDDDWSKLTLSMGQINMMNLEIYDKPGMSVNEIWSKVRKLKRKYKDQDIVVIIDYLQLIIGSPIHRGNRQAEISEVSRMLKNLARDLDVCVIALSQLSRGVESRQDKRPMMSDIRESGQIEQDADVIGFLYRDDYYNKDSEAQNIIEVIIAKQRNGPTGTVNLAYLKEYGSFVNLQRYGGA